jgi:uncharacterized protein YhhL (DUF1145 family)
MAGASGTSLSGLKWIVLGAWLIGALSFLAPGEGGLVAIGRAIFWTLAVVHAIECVVFLPRLRRAPGTLARNLQQTFLYGILHVRELPAAGDAGGGAASD